MGTTQGRTHRSFVLIGKMGDGKSTLGNLIAREEGRPDPFLTHLQSEGVGMTTKVKSVERVLAPGTIYPEGVRIGVFDEPGLNDPNVKIIQHSRNLMECIRRANPLLSVTFLVVVNLAAEAIEPDLVKSILSLAENLATASYSFFNNAVVVFTHADAVVPDRREVDRNDLEEVLNRKCETPEWKWFRYILDWVEGRYLFVNATEQNEAQRIRMLKELFLFSKPQIRVMFHGNCNFKGSEMQQYLGVNGSCTMNLEQYRIACIFNEDIEPHADQDINLDEEIKNVGKLLKEIGQGISVMVVLISLTEAFTNEMLDKINRIPNSYALDNSAWKWWEYAIVIFKVRAQEGMEEIIDRNLRNQGIREILRRTGDRQTWVAKSDLELDRIERRNWCVERVVAKCLEVKKSSEGREYIDRSVLMDMESLIEELRSKHESPNKVMKAGMKVANIAGPVVVGAVGGAVAIGAIGAVGGPITLGVGVVVGGLVGATGGLSVRVAYFIMTKLNPHLMTKFRKKFPDPETRISKEEFYQCFIGYLFPDDD